MLIKPILDNFIKEGTLHIVASSGKKYSFIGTPNPEATLRLHNKKIERHLFLNPDIALGEGYMNGDITIEKGNLNDVLEICTCNYARSSFGSLDKVSEFFIKPIRFIYQINSERKSKNNVAHHYDLNSELFKLFLDSDLQYSCAYFENPKQSLEEAQKQKKQHLAAKLRLQPGQKILDIGSGWGGLSLFLAQYADVDVTGLTLSEEQFKISNERAQKLGLSDRVRFYLRDYRDEKECYDRIVSVGMFEHVGLLFYHQFFNRIHELLTDDGIALLHSIGGSDNRKNRKSWLKKYIFPGGYCPALSEVLPAVESAKLFVTDIEILRYHYAYTLKHWAERFQMQRDKAKALYDERFCRMWEYYLNICQMLFLNLGYMNFQIQLVRNPKISSLTRDYIFINEHVSDTVCKQI